VLNIIRSGPSSAGRRKVAEAQKRIYGSATLTVGDLACRKQVVDEGMNVESDDRGDVEKLDDVDAAAAALDLRDNGLVAAKFFGKVGLAEPRAIALFDKEVDEPDVSG
jgi:hypothetical protein